MCKTVDCTLYKWGVDPITKGNYYQFPEPISVSSVPKSCDFSLIKSQGTVRTFEKGRVVEFNKNNGIVTFIGPKIQSPDSKNKNKRYRFKLHV